MILIFFIYPVPKGSEENQVAPFSVRGKQIDFLDDIALLGIKADTHFIKK